MILLLKKKARRILVVGSRKITNAGSRKVIGKFPSLKMNTAIWWESQIERDYIYLLESDPIVLSYKSQPFSMNYTSLGKKRTYTPDFWVERADFQQVVEVKPITQVNTEKSNPYPDGQRTVRNSPSVNYL